MLGGISDATLTRLEHRDPDFPRLFTLTDAPSQGASRFGLIADFEIYIEKKRARAVAAAAKMPSPAATPAAKAPEPSGRKRRRTSFSEAEAGN